jgi:outer membrane murein-binding lipoprotein Lpp
MFAKKTVDGVLTTFRKAVEDLRQITEQKVEEVELLQVKIAAMRDEQTAAEAEAARAHKIADNISKLISA